jgi:hypothetical protein
MKVLKKILLALAGWGVCAAALAGPVVVDTYAPSQSIKKTQFTIEPDTRPLDADQLRQTLQGVTDDKARGPHTPVAVMLDPALTLEQVAKIRKALDASGLDNVRYFIYDGDRTMVYEAVPRAGEAFPRTRLESEVMAAPK